MSDLDARQKDCETSTRQINLEHVKNDVREIDDAGQENACKSDEVQAG